MPLNLIYDHSGIVKKNVREGRRYVRSDCFNVIASQMQAGNVRTVDVEPPINTLVKKQLDHEVVVARHPTGTPMG